MALPPRRATVLLLLSLALAAIGVFSSADAARAPKALEVQEASAADGRQAQAPTTGSDDAMPVDHVVVVVDKRGGGHGGRGEGGGHGDGEEATRVTHACEQSSHRGQEGGNSRGFGFGGAGYHGYGSGRGHNKSASCGRADGVWKEGVAASVLGAAAWLL